MHVLLTWNPNAWSWTTISQDAATSRGAAGHVDRWSCGNTRDIPIGSRAFLIRLGVEPKGLVASGTVTLAPTEMPHWDIQKAAAGKSALYVTLAFDFIADGSPPIPLSVLKTIDSGFDWTPRASGHRIPEDLAAELERRWAQSTNLGWVSLPDEVDGRLVEGAAERVWVSRVERNPVARRRCIEHHGAVCAACGLAFGRRYGSVADDYMHVHHLAPMASAGGEREVDPIHDLRPLCPNCHAVAHMRLPPFTPDEIASMLAAAPRRAGPPR